MTGKLQAIHRSSALFFSLFIGSAFLFACWTSAATFAKGASRANTPKLNRLAGASSPYLRKHASNPVDWYPWGTEAFAKARREGKPIFLSVGYSTCYWCHVMERESFQNEAIAAFLNKTMVSIKVDRERHPEIDQVYMLATELISRQGGWPNSVFLTTDLKPFHAVTYLPKDLFRKTIERIGKAWASQRPKLEARAAKVSRAISRITTARTRAEARDPKSLQIATKALLGRVDPFNGGLDVAPKFPREPTLLFFLNRADRHRDKSARDAALLTLDHILRGGIHDQLGGGFHRYAIDNAWRIPHFEKMLYNQALIGEALLHAWRITGNWQYHEALRRLLDHVLRDMTAPEGGFYSALDAETKGREGAYYTWTPAEVRRVLGSDAAFAIRVFGIGAHGPLEGSSIPHLPKPVVDLASEMTTDIDSFVRKLRDVRARLLDARFKRPAPKRDEKIITSWNGLMIRTLAEAGVALGHRPYSNAAMRAAQFVNERLSGTGNQLKRLFYDGKADTDGTQDDYAYIALGYLAIYDMTSQKSWLERAVQTTKQMVAKFLDQGAGDFFMTVGTDTFVRPKQREDAELPSGNGAALELLTRLARRHPSPEWRHLADSLAASLSPLALREPARNAYALKSLDILDHGETVPLQYAGKGAVRILASRQNRVIRLKLRIADGWHINAHRPREDYLIATKVSVVGTRAAAVTYPVPILRKLDFNKNEMALYEGVVEIKIELKRKAGKDATVHLGLQTCSDRICLDPEDLVFFVPERPKPASPKR